MTKNRLSAALSKALQKLQEIADVDSDVNDEIDEDFDDAEGDFFSHNDNETDFCMSRSSSDDCSSFDDESHLIEQRINEFIETVANRAFFAEYDESITGEDEINNLKAKNGTQWFKLTENYFTKTRNCIEFKEKYGPTTFAVRHIDQTPFCFLLYF
jgi:hypothetical protein